MASRSKLAFAERAARHHHPVAKRLFEVAKAKKSNLVISADLTNTQSLLACSDSLGPYIVVFKTHVDIVSDFDDSTIQGLAALARKHNFLLFEDRKLVDIGNTVQKQYHGGVLRLSEWADIVNLSVLGGDGIVEALDQTVTAPDFPFRDQRAFLLLAEMTSAGSLAAGSYTRKCIDLARKFPSSMIGFVATRALVEDSSADKDEEDFLIFTTGVNMKSKGDRLGQQYQTPASAVQRGADFVIAGRGIYASEDPVEAARRYQADGWDAYVKRIQ